MKRLMTILIAPLLLMGCGDEPTIQRYESTLPAGFDWPKTEQREGAYESNSMPWVWEVPAGWVDAPEVPDQLVADYRLKGSNESLPGRVTVSVMEGDAGGVQANVLRWLQQLYVTQARTLGPQDKVEQPMRVPYGYATFVELHGQYQGEHNPTHIFAAIVQIPAEDDSIFQTWFFKLAGDEATVDARENRLGMAQMILSLRPKGAGRPELPGIDDASGSGDAEENAQTP